MKERPILFTDPMPQAILAGRKTMTRRVVKCNRFYGEPDWSTAYVDGPANNQYLHVRQSGGKYGDATNQRITCPYGVPGDRLWVREAWFNQNVNGVASPIYRASWPKHDKHSIVMSPPGKWIPSIHMPRWASRITLEITGVKVERLQAISEAEAMAEGCEEEYRDNNGNCWHDKATDAFRRLWDSINGPGSWDANPWVWCVSFKRMEEKS